jgi:cell division protein FtsI/penicillin-binding protein 2
MDQHQRHQVLFEAFAPADDARIAIVVALEAGRSGAHDAAPIARKILDAWLPGDQEREVHAKQAEEIAIAESRSARR